MNLLDDRGPLGLSESEWERYARQTLQLGIVAAGALVAMCGVALYFVIG